MDLCIHHWIITGEGIEPAFGDREVISDRLRDVCGRSEYPEVSAAGRSGQIALGATAR